MGPASMRSKHLDLWADLDDEPVETDEEARRYNIEVAEVIKWKTEGAAPGKTSPMAKMPNVTAEVPVDTGNMSVQSPVPPAPSFPLPLPLGQSAQPRDRVLSAFRKARGITTTTPRLTGHSTLSNIDSPSEVHTPLPMPLKHAPTSRLRHVVDTPDAIDSPIDTPESASSRLADGKVTGQDATSTPVPVPIGNAALSSFRGKKDLQTLTKHFELFNKNVAKDTGGPALSEAGKGNPVGKAVGRNLTGLGLGGKVFEGLRVCIPPELGQVAKHKQRWDIISKLGGHVTLTPDSATTHVIYDRVSASTLIREMGIQALSDLPPQTVIVKWEWVVTCKMAGKIVDTRPWLSFPKPNLGKSSTLATVAGIPAPPRLPSPAEKTSKVVPTGLSRSKSARLPKKRNHTPSDSDTQSPKRRPARSHTTLSWFPTAGPSTSKSMVSKQAPTIATLHAADTGLGWEAAPPGQEDGLDGMISGLKNGTLSENESDDSDREDDNRQGHQREKENTDVYGWKCAESNDGLLAKGPNEWLAVKFDGLHDLYEGVQGKNPFAIRQYSRAASIMRRTTRPITSGKDALAIKGIGQSIADRIDEFINGSMGRAYYEDNEMTRTIALFKDVYGVGRAFANELYARGARSIDDLRKKDHGLTSGQMLGVELYDDLRTRIPREECREIYETIRAEAVGIDPKIWIEIMGSYRRGQESSGDVDILITRDTADGLNHSGLIKKLVDRLEEKGFITHHLSVPSDWKALEAKWMGVVRLGKDGVHRRLDILCVPFENWGAALLYFTGNEIFNRSMRLYARKKGYSLNQRGLSTGVIRDKQGLKMTEGTTIASRTEQEIFDILGLRWRHPHHRRP